MTAETKPHQGLDGVFAGVDPGQACNNCRIDCVAKDQTLAEHQLEHVVEVVDVLLDTNTNQRASHIQKGLKLGLQGARAQAEIVGAVSRV
jgi:hypothetical protein